MTAPLILLIAPASLAFILLIYIVSIYNRLVKRRNMVEEGWSGIEVQLKKRYELIPNLLSTVQAYAKHEKETLEQVTQARTQAIEAEGVQSQQQAEKNLSQAVRQVIGVAEAYPELKANQNYLQLQETLTQVESDLEKARRYYNGTVREHNILAESFPSSVIAAIFSIGTFDFFQHD
jgi:LemA protein